MQPRVGINLEKSLSSTFSEIFAGSGGVDSYTNAISDTYQDNFDEGIFTGKGIYDLEVFEEVMLDKIPENTVLSHDLLEGSYLRCGLVSDIMLLDGFPRGYSSYLTRLSRWIRGDYQILPWLNKDKGLNKLSRFKILDNIRRSLLEITAGISILFLLIIKVLFGAKIGLSLTLTILSVVVSSVIEVLNYIIFRKENIKKQKSFSKRIDGLAASFLRGFVRVYDISDQSVHFG